MCVFIYLFIFVTEIKKKSVLNGLFLVSSELVITMEIHLHAGFRLSFMVL